MGKVLSFTLNTLRIFAILMMVLLVCMVVAGFLGFIAHQFLQAVRDTLIYGDSFP